MGEFDLENRNALLTGRIGPVLLKFAMPFMMASFLQALYGAVDLYVVGQYSGSAAVSAVSIGSQVMMTVTSVLIGISTGGTVLIAHRVEEQALEKAAAAVGTLAVLFLILAGVMTPLMLVLTKAAVSLMSTPAEAVEDAQIYIRICSAGVPFGIGYNGVSAIFRGIGDSKTPVLFIIIACAVNIAGDFLLVGALQMGAAGQYMRTYAINCVLVSFVFNTNSYFSSYGRSLICFVHSMAATFLFRIPATYLFSKIAGDSLLPMGWAAPLASLASIIICLFYLPRLSKEDRIR